MMIIIIIIIIGYRRMRERGIGDLEWVDREGWEKGHLIYFRHRKMWKHQESVYKQKKKVYA